MRSMAFLALDRFRHARITWAPCSAKVLAVSNPAAVESDRQEREPDRKTES